LITSSSPELRSPLSGDESESTASTFLLELFGEQDVQLLDPAFPWLFLYEWLAFSNKISTLKRD
jgi:hypothetical protein